MRKNGFLSDMSAFFILHLPAQIIDSPPRAFRFGFQSFRRRIFPYPSPAGWVAGVRPAGPAGGANSITGVWPAPPRPERSASPASPPPSAPSGAARSQTNGQFPPRRRSQQNSPLSRWPPPILLPRAGRASLCDGAVAPPRPHAVMAEKASAPAEARVG